MTDTFELLTDRLKRCARCKEEKELSEFTSGYCLACKREMGNARESVEILKLGIAYLEKHTDR